MIYTPLQVRCVFLFDYMVSLACFERQGVYRSIALMFLSRDFLESLPKPLHLPGSLASVRGTECSYRPIVPLWSDWADWSLVVETFHWISCLEEPSREGPPLFTSGDDARLPAFVSLYEYPDGTMEREDIKPQSQRIRKERRTPGCERRPLW